MNKMICGAILVASVIALVKPVDAHAEEAKRYTLNELINKAITNSSVLQATQAQALASEGEYRQSRTYDNPELLVEAENFVGSSSYNSYGSAETTVGISQKIVRPSKYYARVKASEYGVRANYGMNEVSRLELIKNVKIAYADIVSAVENLNIAKEQKELANKMLVDIAKRVDAAASPLYQKNKAEVAVATSSIELLKAEKELSDAKANLSLLWGGIKQDYEVDAGNFNNVTEIDLSEERLLDILNGMPDAVALSLLEAQARSVYDLEKANSLSDPTVNLGVRDFRETNDQALVASFSFPIPVFDQNRGNIIKAQNQLSQVGHSNKAKITELKSHALNSFRAMQLAYREVIELRETIIPSSGSAFKQTRIGYDKGKFPYLEVLDAQRTMFEAKFSLNKAIREYHVRKAEVERFLPQQTANNKR